MQSYRIMFQMRWIIFASFSAPLYENVMACAVAYNIRYCSVSIAIVKCTQTDIMYAYVRYHSIPHTQIHNMKMFNVIFDITWSVLLLQPLLIDIIQFRNLWNLGDGKRWTKPNYPNAPNTTFESFICFCCCCFLVSYLSHHSHFLSLYLTSDSSPFLQFLILFFFK